VVPLLIVVGGLHFADQPAATALSIFHRNAGVLLLCFYALAWDGLLLILVALLLGRVFGGRTDLMVGIATAAGVLGGLAQAVGSLRWPFLLPALATTYFDPNTSFETQAAIEVVYESIDRLLGIAIAEHLAHLLIGAWTLLLALHLLRSSLVREWVAVLGVVSGWGMLFGTIEQFGLPGALGSALLAVLALSYTLWAAWLVAMAVTLLRHPSQQATASTAAST
jgi:hypothetical protein